MARRMVGLSFGVALGVALLAACAPEAAVGPSSVTKAPRIVPVNAPPATESPSFRLDKAELRRAGIDATQIAKIDASAFRYFRLLARPYEIRTCDAFRDVRWTLPTVAVHGDLHVEQFVVTSETYGVEDFDQSGYGPAVVDLVRYAASIDLAARELAWRCNADQAVEKFFAAYRSALDKAPPQPHPPAVVDRLRRRAPQARAAWLEWVDRQMLPLPGGDEARARKAWTRFTDLQAAVRPDRPAAFFEIVRAGVLRMGVGSALERKLLVRVRGPSADPDDDVVLEARASEPPGASGCVWRPDQGSALHVLTFMALLGPRMPEVLGYVGLTETADTRPFWVQSWTPGYVELALPDVETQAELDELAEAAASQLAGHYWTRLPEPLRVYQRYAQLKSFDLVRERAMKLARELAQETTLAWERFRRTP